MTPESIGITGELADQMAGQGFISIIEYNPS